MAEAILSVGAGRIIALIEEQARYHVKLERDAEKEVRSLAEELMTVINVLDNAENQRFKDNIINHWLSSLEHTSRDMEDVLDEWDSTILKLQMDPSKKKKAAAVRHIVKKIHNVKAQLDKILKEKDRYNLKISQATTDSLPEFWRIQSTSLIDIARVHGRDKDRDMLATKLLVKAVSQEESGIQVVSIVGVGGLGKTTLAQLVYNDSVVQKFFELRIWICVSKPFDLVSIAKGILESIENRSSPNSNQLDDLFKHVEECISGKRFLLVLDDVWTEDYNEWKPLENSLKCGGAGSKILVTTRNEGVVKMMGSRGSDICHPELLSDEDCWLLLNRTALFRIRNKVEFEEIGKKIAIKCKGLPLVAKTLGSLLRSKSTVEEWENVLNSEIWKMKEAEVDLFPHLLLNYNELSPILKLCFSYCAVFPKDSKIDVESLIGKWMALGYLGSNIGDMELEGRKCFDVLAMRSLFQDFQKNDLDEIKSCKMNDIVHDFAKFVRKAAGTNTITCRACDPVLVSIAKEFGSLHYDKESPPILCDCFVSLRVLSLTNCGLQSIPQKLEKLIHLRWLKLVGINKLSCEDLKIIFQLRNLQTLSFTDCNVEKIPSEIKNLINLRCLNLIGNESLKELPEEIENLIQLRHLNLISNESLKELPESICGLQLIVYFCPSLRGLLQRLVRVTGLHSLREFRGGSGRIKLGLLKNFNHMHLGGSQRLFIRLGVDDDLREVVEDAREAELMKKMHIEKLEIWFVDDERDEKKLVWMDAIIDAIGPHPNLRELRIQNYKSSELPLWMESPFNQLREVLLYDCNHLTSLPSLGKLPCLEKMSIFLMKSLEIVGREFLGITTLGGGETSDVQSSSNTIVVFPKLKALEFRSCYKWKKWEDITPEEEESAALSIMPCLTKLEILHCCRLTALPHRLLSKASSFEKLVIFDAEEIQRRYEDKDGSDWKFISQNNPALQLIYLK